MLGPIPIISNPMLGPIPIISIIGSPVGESGTAEHRYRALQHRYEGNEIGQLRQTDRGHWLPFSISCRHTEDLAMEQVEQASHDQYNESLTQSQRGQRNRDRHKRKMHEGSVPTARRTSPMSAAAIMHSLGCLRLQ
jgi:hypothetical protein